MFDLDALDREISRRFPAETRSQAAARKTYAKITQHKVKLGLSTCIALSTATAVWAFSPDSTAPTIAAEMTYNGMTLAEFAADMGLPATDPHVIFIFQDLCAQEA